MVFYPLFYQHAGRSLKAAGLLFASFASVILLPVLPASAQYAPPRATNGQATTETYIAEPRVYLLGNWQENATNLPTEVSLSTLSTWEMRFPT